MSWSVQEVDSKEFILSWSQEKTGSRRYCWHKFQAKKTVYGKTRNFELTPTKKFAKTHNPEA